MALLLALARNVPQAHGALTEGRWERKNWSGTELMGKTLGILGFGRIGQLVAHRAKAFDMEVIAYDPFVATELYNSLKVQRADSPDDVYAAADFLSLHMPTTDETNGMIDAAAFAKMRDGVRILNVARGSLIVDEDLKDAIDSGKVGGAALDVFRSEPMTDHPLFGYKNVVVTPHLGASTAEATDRAGYQAAEQIVAALQGGSVTTAVNAPSISAEDLELLSPFLPLCAPARQARDGARGVRLGRQDRDRVPRAHRRARHRPARHRRRARRARRSHGGLDQRRQRAVDRQGARHRRRPVALELRARLHRPRARRGVVRRQAPERRRRHDDRQQAPPAPARGVGAALQPPARAVPDAVSLPRRARASSARSA